jgi:hypothetical protein
LLHLGQHNVCLMNNRPHAVTAAPEQSTQTLEERR